MPRDFDAFISYTRQEGAHVAESVLRLLRQQQFRVWQDRTYMRGGEDFWRQIETAIEQSRYLIMVLTPDAFTGERPVLRDEWLTARKRGCQVKPVYMRAHAINFSDPAVPAWLRKLDCYDLDEPNHREKLLNDLRTTPQLQPVPHNVEFPTRFVQREREMRQIVEALCTKAGARVAITTAIQGAGGFGKTTLAKAVCFEDDILARYTDGVLWITVGEGSRTEASLLTGLLAQLGLTPKSGDPEALFGEWKEVLRTRQCLVVLDDVWREVDATALVVRETVSAFLITTRIPRVVSSVDARTCLVDEMELDQGVKVLSTPFRPGEGLDKELRQLVERAGRWPVLLELIAAQLGYKVRQHATPEQAISQVMEDLQELGLEAFDHGNPKHRTSAVRATIEASFRYLEESHPGARDYYRDLAVFPEDEAIPLDAAADLWSVSRKEARRLAERFGDAGLAKLDHQRGLTLHDVFVHHLRSTLELQQLRSLHKRLLSKWTDLHALPHPYAWRWFGWHCIEAGETAPLIVALFDVGWLAKKLAETDTASLLSDYARAANTARAEARSLSLLAEVIEKSSHVLSVEPGQLVAQLFGRLRSGITDRLDDVVEQTERALLSWSLIPETGNLHPVGSPLRRTLRGHEGGVYGALALADGRLLSWSDDNTLRLWSAQGEPLQQLRGHKGRVNGALALADGRLLSWSRDDTLRLWSAQGEPLQQLRGNELVVNGALALADGRLLSWSYGNTLRLWSAQGEPLQQLCGHEGMVNGALALADGRLLSWSDDKTLRLWSAQGEPLQQWRGHEDSVNGALALADGRLLSWSDDNTLRLWSAQGEPLQQLRGHEGRVNGALALADGRLLSWSSDNTLQLWSAQREPLQQLRGHEDSVRGALALADGRLLSWSKDKTLRLWSAQGEPLQQLRGHENSVNGALALADGRLLSWSYDYTLQLWSAQGDPLQQWRGHESSVKGALALADSRLLSWSYDNTLRLWSAQGEPLQPLRGHEGRVNGALALADGRLLSWSFDKTLRLWSGQGEPLQQWRGHESSVNGALALADGRLLSWSDDGTLRLWSAQGDPLQQWRGHESSVKGALALADSRLLSWSDNKTLRLWSAQGEPLQPLRGHEGRVNGALALADGRLLSWSYDNTLRLWSAQGDPLQPLHGHEGRVFGALALADGRLLSWSYDNTLRLWSAQGDPLQPLHGHEGRVNGALALADGRLLSWSDDMTLQLWSAQGDPLQPLYGHGGSVNGALALADGRLLSWSSEKTLRLWSAQGEPLQQLRGHESWVIGALALADGRLLSWSHDNTLRLWSAQGDAVGVLFFDARVTVMKTTRTGIFVGDALGGVHWVRVSPSATRKQS